MIEIYPILCFVRHLSMSDTPNQRFITISGITLKTHKTSEISEFLDRLNRASKNTIYDLNSLKKGESFSVRDLLDKYPYVINIKAPAEFTYGELYKKACFWLECVNTSLRLNFLGPTYCDFCLIIKNCEDGNYEVGRSYHPLRSHTWISNVDWPDRDSICSLDGNNLYYLTYYTSYLAYHKDTLKYISDFVESYFMSYYKDMIRSCFSFLDGMLTCGKSKKRANKIARRAVLIVAKGEPINSKLERDIKTMYNKVRGNIFHGVSDASISNKEMHRCCDLITSISRGLINFFVKYHEIHGVNLLTNSAMRLKYYKALEEDQNRDPFAVQIPE